MRSTSGSAFRPDSGYDSAAWFVAVLGIALSAAGLGQVYVDPEPILVQSIESALVVGPALALIAAGYWTGTRGLDYDAQWSIATWALLGCLIAGALVAGYLYAEWLVGNPVTDASLLFVVGTASGGAVGVLAAVANHRPASGRSVTDGETGGDGDRRSPDDPTDAPHELGERSQFVLHAVALADGPLPVETLASRIASLEHANESAVCLDLVHERLPKLSRNGCLQYDPVRGVVRPPRAESLEGD